MVIRALRVCRKYPRRECATSNPNFCWLSDGDISADEDLPDSVAPLSGYYIYKSSEADIPFSEKFLDSLTIQRCLELTIPPILPENCVQLVGWSRVEPTASHFLLAGGYIPCLKNVCAFLPDMCTQFAKGNRCLVVEAQGEQT